MTMPEQEPLVITPDHEPTPQERFLSDLYDHIHSWMKEQGGEVVEEFGPQEVRDWRDLGPKHPQQGGMSVGANIFRAILLRSPNRDFALALSSGIRGHYHHGEELAMQFGMMPRDEDEEPSKFRESQTPIEEIGLLVSDHMFSYGSGEFYIDKYSGKVKINCWANSRGFGGKDLGSWGGDIPLDQSGRDACLEVVKRVDRNAFV